MSLPFFLGVHIRKVDGAWILTDSTVFHTESELTDSLDSISLDTSRGSANTGQSGPIASKVKKEKNIKLNGMFCFEINSWVAQYRLNFPSPFSHILNFPFVAFSFNSELGHSLYVFYVPRPILGFYDGEASYRSDSIGQIRSDRIRLVKSDQRDQITQIVADQIT